MNQHLLDAYNSTLDGDEWGNCQSWRFSVAHVLWHMGLCPDEWQYHHGLCFVEDPHFEEYEEQELYYLFTENKITTQDMIDFGDALENLRDLLVDEGRDY